MCTDNKTAEDLSLHLKEIFGFDSFRPNQEEIIRTTLKGRDVFAVMPTGGGKSLCYQLPAGLMQGTGIVVSPLISLMKDQVDGACSMGLKAAYFNSTLTSSEMAKVYDKLHRGSLDLLYVAPERFAMEDFLARLSSVRLGLFAVDEAHCVSEWGHDFRPDYLSLSVITKRFAEVPIAAFTATATEQVQHDIITKLGLRSPFTVRASFNRPNLFYRVLPKQAADRQILDFLQEHADQSGIVYRTTRESVEQTAGFLQARGISALPYHAGLDNTVREKNQDAFNRDEVQIIVATIAFGMGIDKSNVRFVVHGDLPKNIEGYYQETGRAGRDGEPAHCLLLFGRGDIPKIRYFIEQVDIQKERRIAVEKLNRMANYASFYVCRRKQLLSYFGENYAAENCGVCDVCVDTIETEDATTEAQMAMSAIVRVKQRFGTGHIVDIVTGAQTKRIRQLGHDRLKTYGVGSHREKRFWHGLIDELITRECILPTDELYPVLQLTPKGHAVLGGNKNFSILKRNEKTKSRKITSFEEYNHALFEQLRLLRQQLARRDNVPPFVVFSDRTLHEMCRKFPVTDDEMLSVSGVGEQKMLRYGRMFLKAVQGFVKENPGQIIKPGTDTVPSEKNTSRKRAKGRSLAETGQLARQGLSFSQIAERRGLKTSTISEHLELLFKEKHTIDIDCHVNPQKRQDIEKAFQRMGTEFLRPIVEHLKGRVSYDEARVVRGYLIGRAKGGRRNADLSTSSG